MIHLKNFKKYFPIQNFDSPGGSEGKATVYNVRDLGLIPGLGRSSAEGKCNPLLSTLALKIPWTEELGAGYYPWGGKELGTTEQLHCLYTKFEKWKID